MIKISVVIPCRNEVLYIHECIEAIYGNKLRSEVVLSVFVVDGMSDDGTRDILHALAAKNKLLRIIDNPNR